MRWQGVRDATQAVLDALLDAIEVLQGTALLASDLEPKLFRRAFRITSPWGFRSRRADRSRVKLCGSAAEPLGDRDGRSALYLTEACPLYVRQRNRSRAEQPLSERAKKIEEYLSANGRVFLSGDSLLHPAAGAGYPGETCSMHYGSWCGVAR